MKQTIKQYGVRVGAGVVAVSPFLVHAEDVDPTVQVLAKLAQAAVYGASIGGASLAVIAAIAAFKYIRRAI